jgi:hypothetical protein
MWSGDAVNMLSTCPRAEADGAPLLVPAGRQAAWSTTTCSSCSRSPRPGDDAPVPQPHARLRGTRSRTSASPATSRRRTRSRRKLVSDGFVPRTWRPRWSAGGLGRRASTSSSCRRPRTPRGRRCGSSSRPAPNEVVTVGSPTVPDGSGRASPCRASLWLAFLFLAPAVRRAVPRVRHGRPDLPSPSRCGTRCSGTLTQFSTSSATSSGRRLLRAGPRAHRRLRPARERGLPAIAYPVAYFVCRFGGRRKGCCSRCSSRRSGSAT